MENQMQMQMQKQKAITRARVRARKTSIQCKEKGDYTELYKFISENQDILFEGCERLNWDFVDFLNSLFPDHSTR